jgi:hypothetical protein
MGFNYTGKQRLQAAQIKLLRPLLGFIKLKHQRNTDIRERLQVQNSVEGMHDCQGKWKKRIERVQRDR